MTDEEKALVERLRQHEDYVHPETLRRYIEERLEAADMIEAMSAENEKLLFCQQWIAEQAAEIERLRGALEEMINNDLGYESMVYQDAAKAALNGGDD